MARLLSGSRVGVYRAGCVACSAKQEEEEIGTIEAVKNRGCILRPLYRRVRCERERVKEEKGQEGTKGDEPVGRNGSAGDQGIPKRSPISERETGCTGVHIGCGYNLVSLRSRNRTFRVSLLALGCLTVRGSPGNIFPSAFVK